MTELYNLKYLPYQGRGARNEPTSAEQFLWSKLRNKQLAGKKFRRQHSVGNYILDFYCPEYRLAIELDGDSHFTQSGVEHDKTRTAFLNQANIQVLRFTNTEVFENLEGAKEHARNKTTP